MKKIDLHLHTDDGLRQLIQDAQKDNYHMIAITDHNRFTITAPFMEKELLVLPGCEFDCRYATEKQTCSVHILGIFPDGIENTGIFFSDHMEIDYRNYLEAILQKLSENQVPISLKELLSDPNTSPLHINRLHIAAAMVKHNYVSSIEEAMDHYLGIKSPLYVDPLRFVSYKDMKTIIRLILQFKGIPILAHPLNVIGNDPTDVEQLIRDFALALHGFAGGIEVWYNKYLNTPKTGWLHQLAVKYRLFESISSDRHLSGTPFAKGVHKNDELAAMFSPKVLRKPRLVVISGPSGAGKTTIIRKLLPLDPSIELVKSVTTRKPRGNENGYFFVKDETSFRNWPGGYLEVNRYNNNFYGTPLSEIKRIMANGKIPLLDIDIHGFKQLQALGQYEITSFYISVPSDVLYNRLLARNTEPLSIILQRLSIASKEMESPILDAYSYSIPNDATPEKAAYMISQSLKKRKEL